jgi:hypothetical protein
MDLVEAAVPTKGGADVPRPARRVKAETDPKISQS